MPHRILTLSALSLVALAAAAGAYASLSGSGPRMGPSTSISHPAFHGYYDGHKDTYLNTDVSDKAEAGAMHINYAPVLKTVPLKSAPEMYLVQARQQRRNSRSSALSLAKRATRRFGRRRF